MWKNPLKPKPVEPIDVVEEKPPVTKAQPTPEPVEEETPTDSTPDPIPDPVKTTSEEVVKEVVGPESETETDPTPVRVRAHEEDGTFTADDPSTPDVDEAFVDGGPVSYDKKTKKELLKIAGEMGLGDLSMADTKKSILATITAAE